MPGNYSRQFAIALLALAMAGCQQNPFAASPPPQPSVYQQQQQLAMLQQQQTLQSRTSSLDIDNQDLQTKLAQAQQQNHLLQDQLTVTREQLNSTTQQLTQTRESQQSTEQQAQVMAASMRKRNAASISANNSLERNLPTINIPGVEVRQDGDVVRVEMPVDRLFNPGTAQIRQDAVPMLDTVASELEHSYPMQIIGVEGHTDSDPPPPGVFATDHQLSIARAAAVFDYLTTRGRMRPQQLFVVGHGANHPVVSNASLPGKARNRRVELVVYPDQWQQ
ncbi:MAG TPA: OmpA family protein [Pirellulales bacterium]|nr:OmpA family protein [Pirellulales bacterium]